MKRASSSTNQSKRQRKEKSKICIRIPLTEKWCTVILSNGDRFYYDKERNESYWQIPEGRSDEAEMKVNELSKYIILIVGIVRGLDYERYLKRLEGGMEVIDTVKKLIGWKEEEEEKKPEEEEEALDQRQMQQTVGLEVGYSSESASDSDDAGAAGDAGDAYAGDADDAGSDTDEYALDLSDVEELISDTEATDSKEDSLQSQNFFEMLSRKHVDPFSSYDLEIDTFYTEPEFVAIENDSRRAELFDAWSQKQHKETERPLINASENFLSWLSQLSKVPKYYFELKRNFRKELKEFMMTDAQQKKLFKQYQKDLHQ
ncbi:hypothetical protein FOA43_001749 [Brettanomyces nanus]|uniref:WW domain-containing protein n=1 Tax=Eeniella nana TaxID=13502 RepID=A0A875RP14_EENNA|nr:uncharacterized protein FOA43_001749 [Brettanomyces nanus]QPG74420.1 hypothetical protein FOA43_001749 [Brettanomyces nanus]